MNTDTSITPRRDGFRRVTAALALLALIVLAGPPGEAHAIEMTARTAAPAPPAALGPAQPSLPKAPPPPAEQAPILWNGGFPGIVPGQMIAYRGSADVGTSMPAPPMPIRRLQMLIASQALWASWNSCGFLTGMSFAEWIAAFGPGASQIVVQPRVQAR
ncbi:MAG TPA: hypothetical protein PKC43_00390 [Phycisphaerales bacterium]|nr:hypothetical protein [Phycisphaerales bacterium]HMP35883.1 hypothetical protein [Phycisphaerales bacterium]